MKRIWIVSRDKNDENDKKYDNPLQSMFLHNVRPVRIPLDWLIDSAHVKCDF